MHFALYRLRSSGYKLSETLKLSLIKNLVLPSLDYASVVLTDISGNDGNLENGKICIQLPRILSIDYFKNCAVPKAIVFPIYAVAMVTTSVRKF